MIIKNDGPQIVLSDYWDTEHARNGLLYLSINAYSFRLLVPDTMAQLVDELRRGAKYVILSQLAPEQWSDRELCTEWLVEDGGDEPFVLHLSPGQVDRCLPDEPTTGCGATVWLRGPAKVIDLPAMFRRVDRLPWLKPWGES
jgi:hypothetical protein